MERSSRFAGLRRVVLIALAVGAAVVVLAAPGSASPAAPTAPAPPDACELRVGGRDLESATKGDPIRIPIDGSTTISGRTPEGTHEVTAYVEFAFGGQRLHAKDLQDGVVERILTPKKHVKYGIGLYHVSVTADGCHKRAGYVLVTGSAPGEPHQADDLPTQAAKVAGLLSLGLVAVSLTRAYRGTSSGWLAVVGAVIAGLTLNFIEQRQGHRTMTTESAVMFGGLPGIGMAGIRRTLKALGASRRKGGDDGDDEPPGRRARVRFLQAEVRKLAPSGRATKVIKGFTPGAKHRVDVWIGPTTDAFRLATPFPQELLPTPDGEHELTVVLTEASCLKKPLVQQIVLPASGKSAIATFELKVPKRTRLIDARIVVLHGNRVLQSAILRSPARARFEADDTIELVAEAVVRANLDDLSGRSDFGAAIVLDKTADGQATMTTVHDGVAQHLMLDDGIRDVVVLISERLTELSADPDLAVDLDTPEMAELLCTLANHGAILRDKLLEAQVVDPAILDERRLQLLSVHPDTFLPIEFIYDRPAPDPTAPLCPGAAKALRDGACAGDCPSGVDAPSVVCPLGFWSLNRVVERHATTPQRRAGAGGADATLQSDPTASRNELAPVGSALLAFSKKVDPPSRPTSSADLQKVLERVTGGRASTASSWREWVDLVERESPSLLVLLSHTDEDKVTSIPVLEIADQERLLASHLETPYIRSSRSTSPPIVLLLGCETALAGGLEQFMTSFQQKGAGIVVGTLATVLGYQAAPVAAALVEAIELATETPELSFGDVMVALRRQLLADGYAMSMALTAYGDADWRFVPSSGGSR